MSAHLETLSNGSLGAAQTPSKAARLRAMLLSPDLEFLMEAHDGISAKIVEEAGFKGIWASGLSVSAALGVRDNNEASWTQVLEVLEFMSDATSIPILVDGDTGYGNFNNARRVVQKLCQRDIAGICIEDKLFPKTNSFIGEGQPLADVDEFCGKLKAVKDSQTNSDFCLVARIEALIAGWGLDEALRRAEAYHNAGADAVLIHSKQAVADEVLAFCKEWDNRCPVVIVPTKYYKTPTDMFREHGVSVAIWANHNLRASITAMREISSQIKRDESLAAVEGGIIGVKEVFELTGNDELAEAEKRYLPSPREGLRAIILAASRGKALGELTENRPKCMIDVRGKPLLRRLVDNLNDGGIRDITVVRGYQKEAINLPSIKTADNDLFASTGEVASLACAADRLEGPSLIAYGDVLFRRYILDRLMEVDADIVLAVDGLWRERESKAEHWVRDLVECSKAFSAQYLEDDLVELKTVGPRLLQESATGEWIGLAKFSRHGSDLACKQIEKMKADGTFQKASLTDLFAGLLDEGVQISVLYVSGHWLDVDDAADLAKAHDFL
jgi:phosphoenolpyruvate phosphomutase